MTRELTTTTDNETPFSTGKGALLAMLSYKRPYESEMEITFIKKYLVPLASLKHVSMTADGIGNIIVVVGDNPTISYSSHTDTVHHFGGKQDLKVYKGKYKKTGEETEFVTISQESENKSEKKWDKKLKKYTTRYTYDRKGSNCLGADDTTGVWLMREMILAKKEGLYIFHRGEECGGVGSRWIVKNTPELVKGIDCMIAFDRCDRDEIITHQMSRCASDKFAKSLGDILYEADHDLKLLPSSNGIYTDSAEYVDLIGECTNVAVGYFGHHGRNEHQDLTYALKLRDALIEMDTDKLVFEREPGEHDYDDWYGGNYGSVGGYGNYGSYYPNSSKKNKPKNSLYTTIYNNPWEVSVWLEELGYGHEEIQGHIDRINEES